MRTVRLSPRGFRVLCLVAVTPTIPAYADFRPVLPSDRRRASGGCYQRVAYYDNYIYFNVGHGWRAWGRFRLQPGQPVKPERYRGDPARRTAGIKVANRLPLPGALGSSRTSPLSIRSDARNRRIRRAAEEAQGSGPDAVMSVSNIAGVVTLSLRRRRDSGIVALTSADKNHPTFVTTDHVCQPARIITDVEYAPGRRRQRRTFMRPPTTTPSIRYLRAGVIKFDLCRLGDTQSTHEGPRAD